MNASQQRHAAWRKTRDRQQRDRARGQLDVVLGLVPEDRKPVVWSSAYFVSPGVMYSPSRDEYVTVGPTW